MSETSVPEKEKCRRPKNPKKVHRWEEPEKPVNTKTRSVSNSFFSNQARWTYRQRGELLRLLKLCPSESELHKIYNNIPSHTPEEVEEEISRLRNAASLQCSGGQQLQAPIETWLDFCEEMVHYEEEDHSKCLGRAMSIVANYEKFKKEENKPDYKNLYRYIAAILNGVEPPKLSPLDSLVVVDLMHSLVDVLSETDTSKQRAVMKWKFSMLNCKVNINNLKETEAQTYKALANVFPEDLFTANPHQGPSQGGQSTSTAGNVEPASVEPSDQQTLKSPTRSSTLRETTPDQDAGQDCQIPSSSSAQGETTQSQVCQAFEQNVKNNDSNQTDDFSEEGEFSSKSGAQGEITPNHDAGEGSHALEQNSKHKQTGNNSEHEEPPSKKICVRGGRRGRGRGRGRGKGGYPGRGQGTRISEGEGPLVKPQLYTLNPFSVPVEILKLPKTKKKGRPKRVFKSI